MMNVTVIANKRGVFFRTHFQMNDFSVAIFNT